jgi:hypothetical protein
MTNRQQSAFFLAIVFLFTSGIGLVIYRQYDQYYAQKAAADLETAQTPSLAVEKLATSATTGWKTYTYDEFEFKYPSDWNIQQNGSSALNVCGLKFGCGNNYISVVRTDKTMADAYVDTTQYQVQQLASKTYNEINWDFFTASQSNAYIMNYRSNVAETESKGNYYIIILFSQNDENDYKITTPIWNQIVSTFKFTK